MRRIFTDKVFWLILVAGVLGFAGHDLWVIAPLAVVLTLWSTISDQRWFDEFKRIGRVDALLYFWLECLAQNGLFVGAAFVMGARLSHGGGSDSQVVSSFETDVAG